jgi:hypothetical protein
MLGRCLDVLRGLRDVLRGFWNVLGRLGDVLRRFRNVLGRLGDVLRGLRNMLGRFGDMFGGLWNVFGGFGDMLGWFRNVFGGFRNMLGWLWHMFGRLRNMLGRLGLPGVVSWRTWRWVSRRSRHMLGRFSCVLGRSTRRGVVDRAGCGVVNRAGRCGVMDSARCRSVLGGLYGRTDVVHRARSGCVLGRLRSVVRRGDSRAGMMNRARSRKVARGQQASRMMSSGAGGVVNRGTGGMVNCGGGGMMSRRDRHGNCVGFELGAERHSRMFTRLFGRVRNRDSLGAEGGSSEHQ